MNDWIALFPIKFNGPTFWKGEKKMLPLFIYFQMCVGLDDAFLASLFHFTGAHGFHLNALLCHHLLSAHIRHTLLKRIK